MDARFRNIFFFGICLLLAVVFRTANASAGAVCEGLQGGVKLLPDGTMRTMGNGDSDKELILLKKSAFLRVYKSDKGLKLNELGREDYVYTVNFSSGKPDKLRIKKNIKPVLGTTVSETTEMLIDYKSIPGRCIVKIVTPPDVTPKEASTPPPTPTIAPTQLGALTNTIKVGTEAPKEADFLSCKDIPGHVEVLSDGSLVERAKNGSYKKLSPVKKTGHVTTYKKDRYMEWTTLTRNSVEYAVEKAPGKPIKLKLLTTISAVGSTVDEFSEYELGYDSNQKCIVKRITDKPETPSSEPVVIYDDALCENLVKKFDRIAKPSELQKCNEILSEMSDAVKKFEETKSLAVEPDGTGLIQKSLMFASRCKQLLAKTKKNERSEKSTSTQFQGTK